MDRVLLVEDDGSIAEIVRYYLSQSGQYEVDVAQNAAGALERVGGGGQYDVILLDIMLPDVDGVELCAQLRESLYCPIIFISCIDGEDTIIRALRMGGDDYLVKPFTCEMLQARMEANLRRMRGGRGGGILSFPSFELDRAGHAIVRNGERKGLSPIEFNLLEFFLQHPNQNFSLSVLYENIWGRPSLGDVRTVMVHIHNLRKKIEDDPNAPVYLRSTRGRRSRNMLE